ISAEDLVEADQLAQLQGVFLRAVRVVVHLEAARPEDYRLLFQKLKFRRLMWRLEKTERGYRLEIDGPFALFEAVTKYGLELALMVPLLLSFGALSLHAELRWGKERRPLSFHYKQEASLSAEQLAVYRRDEVTELAAGLQKQAQKKGIHLEFEEQVELLDIPGVGLCVPDLKLRLDGGPPLSIEVLGYWSRDAVWRRVEWAEAAASRGEPRLLLFCVSSRLRVSESVLPKETGASLYTYKGKMNAAAVLKSLLALTEAK
ncbi:MAG: DUF790 family protein, partial [Polyangiaceae bacterium]|nr:DUF790 family protein [Polyangiaceae bacterium]